MKYYVLVSPKDTKRIAVTDSVDVEPVYRGEAPKCPVCGGYVGMLPWLPPHRAQLEVWGREYGDITFGPGDSLLISERMADLYRAEGLTGLEGFHEVEIAKVIRRGGSKLRTSPPKYYCVSVVRSRAAIDLIASEFVHEKTVTCNECRQGQIIKRWERIVLEENTWSGEDIFRPRGLSGEIMTSERFKEFFERNHINNGILINAAEYSHDFYPWEKIVDNE